MVAVQACPRCCSGSRRGFKIALCHLLGGKVAAIHVPVASGTVDVTGRVMWKTFYQCAEADGFVSSALEAGT
jgi:hypothetical protein